MSGAQHSGSTPTSCSLSSQPAACFAKYRESHLLKARRHSWESIGECHGCKLARVNAVIAFTPEPDDPGERGRACHVVIDPRDFLGDGETLPPAPPVKGKKPRLSCCRGHRYSVHGVRRKDGKWWCRVCEQFRDRSKRDRGPSIPEAEVPKCPKGHKEWGTRRGRNGKTNRYCKACGRERDKVRRAA